MPERHLYTFALALREDNSKLSLDSFQHGHQINRLRFLQKHLYNLAGGLALLFEHMGQVDIALVGYHHIRQDHIAQFLLDLLLTQSPLGRGDFFVQEQKRASDQILRLNIEVAAFTSGPLQRIEQGSLYAHRVVKVSARFLNDGIYSTETKAGNLAEAIRTLPYQRNTARAEVLIDLHRCCRGDLKRSQNGHQVTHDFALRITVLDVLQPFFRNASDLQQLLRMVFNHIQRLEPKAQDDGISRLFSNAFQKAGCQITPDTFKRWRNDLAPPLNLQLTTMRALRPVTVILEVHSIGLRQVIAYCNEPDQVIAVSKRAACFLRNHNVCGLEPQDRVFAGSVKK